MASPGVSRLPLTRTVKKVEKPRPLKSSQNKPAGDLLRLNTYDEVMKLADVVVSQLYNGGPNERSETMQNITSLASHLKLYGQQLEGIYGDQLDRTFTALRNFANDDRFDILTRLRLLELIELRAMHWTTTEDAISYYQHKMGKAEAQLSPTVGEMHGPGSSTPTSASLPFPFTPSVPFMASPVSTTPPPALLAPGEVIKPSGKYALPTKVPGKSYLKDEVVIRNADSGKVMGIKGRRVHMIEELSETIISFQRVSPGTKERLVQITGPSEERIDYARQLIEETIRRNASPSRPEEVSVAGTGTMGSNSSLNSSASDENSRPQRLSESRSTRRANSLLVHSLSTNDASVGEYKYTVTVGNSALRITGPDLKLVRAAKLVLDEYFSKPNWQNWGPGEDFNTIEEDHLYFSETEVNESEATSHQANCTAAVPEKTTVATVKQEISAKDAEVVKPPEKAAYSPPRICYTREYLLNCSKSPHARQALPNWWNIARQHPGVARKVQSNPLDFSRLPVPQCRPIPTTEPLVPFNAPVETEDQCLEHMESMYDLPDFSDSPVDDELFETTCQQNFKPTAYSIPKQTQNLLSLDTCFENWD